MPQISRFLGIIISMYFDDHNPPYFHAQYNKYKIQIRINDLSVIEGKLPPRVLGLVIEWATIHQDELAENWNHIEQKQPLNKIEPLQ